MVEVEASLKCETGIETTTDPLAAFLIEQATNPLAEANLNLEKADAHTEVRHLLGVIDIHTDTEINHLPETIKFHNDTEVHHLIELTIITRDNSLLPE